MIPFPKKKYNIIYADPAWHFKHWNDETVTRKAPYDVMSKEDIKNLTKKRAIEIYHRYYWIPSKASQLPDKLQETYFDMAVNMGTSRAVKILQQACNSRGCKLVVDGRIGPKTMKASKKINKSRLQVYRILYYTDLIRRRKSLMVFIVGWIRRAMEA